MRGNMYVGSLTCDEVARYLHLDEEATVVGVDAKQLVTCENVEELLALGREIVLVPRTITSFGDVSKAPTLGREAVVGLAPLSVESARRLAKISAPIIVVMDVTTIRFVDKAQVNYMRQSPARKFLEVHLGGFVERIGDPKAANLNRDLHNLGNVIERALKLGVGVVVSSAAPSLSKILLTTHLDIVLLYMGFTKRERRLMLELYPLELVKLWINTLRA